MSSAPYDSIAKLYDGNWGHEFAKAACAAVDTQLLPQCPGGCLLDVCCGTGLVLAHCGQLGFDTFGIDESAGMLEVARQNAPGAALQQADMAAFRWNARFDAALWFYNSVNHARSPDHLLETLRNIALHLKRSGFLLFDYVTPDGFVNGWNASESIDHEGSRISLDYRYEHATQQATCSIDRRVRIHQIPIERDLLHRALRAADFAVCMETEMAELPPRGARVLVLATRQ